MPVNQWSGDRMEFSQSLTKGLGQLCGPLLTLHDVVLGILLETFERLAAIY